MGIDDVHIDEEIVGFLLSRLLVGKEDSALFRLDCVVEDLHQSITGGTHNLIQFRVPQRSNDTGWIAHLNLTFGLSEIISIEEIKWTDIGRIIGILRGFLSRGGASDQEAIIRREGDVCHRVPIVQTTELGQRFFEFTDVP